MISKHKYYESSYLLFVNKKYLFKNVHSYEKYYTFLYTSREFYSSLEIFRYRNEKVFSMKIFVIPWNPLLPSARGIYQNKNKPATMLRAIFLPCFKYRLLKGNSRLSCW